MNNSVVTDSGKKKPGSILVCLGSPFDINSFQKMMDRSEVQIEFISAQGNHSGWKISCDADLAVIDPAGQSRYASRIAEQLLQNQIPFVLFSGQIKIAWLSWSLRCGCVGCIDHEKTMEETAEIICGILSRTISHYWVESVDPLIDRSQGVAQLREGTIPKLLTEQQLEIFVLLAEGKTVKEVARLLNITSKSVDSHKYRIMKKLNLHDRVQLSRLAIREGWIDA